MKSLPVYALALAILFGTALLGINLRAATLNGSIPPTMAIVVANCGTPPLTYSAGDLQPLTMSTGGALCVNQ